MKKTTKLLSLILSVSLASQMISSVNINATKDSITFYDVKNNILDLKAYDAELDTNHDGNMNVFDVIRANKTLIQEESYTDLKEKVYMLETQIESLYQKLNEKSDKEEGKQLSSNDYTDEEKQKLESLNNYDDTKINEKIDSLVNTAYDEKKQVESSINNKVEKEEGKQLSSNDYTDEEKQKLECLNNYDDTQIKSEVSELSGSLSSKVDKEEGKLLSSNDYTDEEKQKLESLNNYDDTNIKNEITEINSALNDIEDAIKYSKYEFEELENKNTMVYGGIIESNNSYNHSNPIEISKGSKITGETFSDNSNVWTVSECDSNGENLSLLIRGSQNSNTNFSYTFDRDTYIIVTLHSGDSYFYIQDDISYQAKDEIIYIGENQEFTTIKEGFEYAIKNKCEVVILPGTYDLVAEGISGKGYMLPRKVVGYGAKLICNLETEDWNLSPLNVNPENDSTWLEGVEIECSNCRYCIHDEMYERLNLYPYHNVFKNLKLTNNSNASSVLINPNCIGGGLGLLGTVEVINCIANSKVNLTISYHSRDASSTLGGGNCNVYVTGCKVNHTIGGASIGYVSGDTSMNHIYISNNKCGTLPQSWSEGNMTIETWNNYDDTNEITNNQINVKGEVSYSYTTIIPFKFNLSNNSKLIFSGDSITAGVTSKSDGTRETGTGYVGYLRNMLGCTVTNLGVSNSSYHAMPDVSEGNTSIISKLRTSTLDGDYLFIAGGTNDYNWGVSESDFKQSLIETYDYIDSNFNGKVVVMLPINNVIKTAYQINGLKSYREWIFEEAVSRGYGIIDCDDFGFPDSDNLWRESVMCDLLHPSDLGHKMYANAIYTIIKK